MLHLLLPAGKLMQSGQHVADLGYLSSTQACGSHGHAGQHLRGGSPCVEQGQCPDSQALGAEGASTLILQGEASHIEPI